MFVDAFTGGDRGGIVVVGVGAHIHDGVGVLLPGGHELRLQEAGEGHAAGVLLDDAILDGDQVD